jgi:hypothetical protein
VYIRKLRRQEKLDFIKAKRDKKLVYGAGIKLTGNGVVIPLVGGDDVDLNFVGDSKERASWKTKEIK